MADSHYHVVQNLPELERFIQWLSDLGIHEKFYVSLFARRKYDRSIKGSDKANLRRFLSNKESLVYKIRQLEIPLGRYITKGVTVEDGALALYINPNPRCMRKATFLLVRELMNRLENEKQEFNPNSESMTAIHKSKSRTVWVDFDIDLDCPADQKQSKIARCVDTVRGIVGVEASTFVETRGGLHCLVNPAMVDGEKHWHQKITRSLTVDQVGDLLMPVPGCCQGGFVPKLI